MQQAINERIDVFISMFNALIKENVEDIDNIHFKDADLINQIKDQDKQYFLINDENFDEVVMEVSETLKYNLNQSGQKVNSQKVFKQFFNSFKEFINNNKEIRNQVNEAYKGYLTNKHEMQVEEPSEEEENVFFDDEIEFTKVFSNKPMGFKNTKGNNDVAIELTPRDYGFSSFYLDPAVNRLAVINQLKALENRYKSFLDKEGYFEAGDVSLIKDVYRVGRVLIFESQVQPETYKNVTFEQLEGDTLKNIQLSFEHIDNKLIYSGQCIVIRTSTINSKIEVKEILSDVPGGYEPAGNKIEEEKHVDRVSNCNITMVKGPFFNPDKYELKIAISKLKACTGKANTNVLIVKGPIVHQNYKKQTDVSYEDAKNTFISMLNDLPVANIIYVNEPTEKTNINFMPVNPSESFGRIIQAPNPCVINVGGYRFGVTDERLLDEMIFNSIILDRGQKSKKMDLATNAIYESHSLLPLFNTNIYSDWSKYSGFVVEEPVDVFFVHSNKCDATVSKIGQTQFANLKCFSKPNCFGSYANVKLAGEGKIYVELFECEEEDE